MLITLSEAIRFSEIILSVAIAQQNLEFCRGFSPEKYWGWLRFILAIFLCIGFATAPVKLALLFSGLYLVWRFRGPYCGGSDTMSLLVLSGLTLSDWVPNYAREWVIGYIAFQLIMSYWQSGWVKVVNPEWRKGNALFQVFAYSAYPVSYAVRSWAQQPRVLFGMGWSVIIFELLFPLSLLNEYALLLALLFAFAFHCANAGLFGLNRFVLAWLSAYPLLIWFQGRLFA